ncbi:MAG: prolyl oligopeptidase family serine peptidase, partial [Propionicimonas sp.]
MSAVVAGIPSSIDPDRPDPLGWLEDVDGDAALAWVRERNAEADAGLAADPGFAAVRAEIREVLDSDDRIPEVSRIGDRYYNFWRDAAHERGLWRRTTLQSYRTDAPDWEIVLDLDALNAAEQESWVWQGASALRPAEPGQPWRRALVTLSPGGSDADVTREFDLVEKRFLSPQEGGFHRPQAKGELGWVDQDTVFVSTDFGDGTMTTSGYPRTARLWRRGTPLESATPVFEGEEGDVYIAAYRSRVPGFERDIVHRAITFYTSQTYLVTGLGSPDQALVKLDVPESAEVGFHREWLVVELRDDWKVGGGHWRAGSLLAVRADDFLAGSRDFTALFEPSATTSLAGVAWTRHHAVVNVLDDVKNRLHVLTPPQPAGRDWLRSPFPALDGVLAVGVGAVDPVDSDDAWLVTTGHLTPSTLSLVRVGGPDATAVPEQLKAAPAFFDASGLVTEQRFATSADGTRVPYFIVGSAGQLEPAAGQGPAPTLLYGYGGFEISLTPAYSGAIGRAWLSRGGVYVVANIRGGGEYGPAWHQSALKANRHRAYADFAAVARDLVAAGVTTASRLGAQGGSNGGLLMGNMLTQYPD